MEKVMVKRPSELVISEHSTVIRKEVLADF